MPSSSSTLKSNEHQLHTNTTRDQTLFDRPHSRNGSIGWRAAVGGDVEQRSPAPRPELRPRHGRVIRWINPAAERLLGDVRGRHFTSVVGPEDRERGAGALRPQGARHDRGDRDERGFVPTDEPASR